jgi:hypothetical protein
MARVSLIVTSCAILRHETFLAFLLSLNAFAQAPAPVTPELHENVLKLVDVFGMKAYLQTALQQVLEDGKAAALAKSPKLADEWERRMHQRITLDDYLAIAARAFEANFSMDEVKELITVLQNRKLGQPAVPSAQLGAKLNEVMPTLTRQVEAIATGTGAKAAKDVSDEIEKEYQTPGTATQPATPTLR